MRKTINKRVKIWNDESSKISKLTDPNTRVEVVYGDITFFDKDIDKKIEAHINRIDGIAICPIDELDDFCEIVLENAESYLIPSQYSGLIVNNI